MPETEESFTAGVGSLIHFEAKKYWIKNPTSQILFSINILNILLFFCMSNGKEI